VEAVAADNRPIDSGFFQTTTTRLCGPGAGGFSILSDKIELTLCESTSKGVMKMINENELRDVLTDAVENISRLESNPRTWLSWILFLLARLEEKATNESAANKESFLEMLAALQDEIRNRMKTGGWN
jgi:hypothetical protein